jgi:hypothetical protein
MLLSALALIQAWRSDSAVRDLIERLSKTHQREADRVDDLIKNLMDQSRGSAS